MFYDFLDQNKKMFIGAAFLSDQNEMNINIFLKRQFHPDLRDMYSKNNILLFKTKQKYLYPLLFVCENQCYHKFKRYCRSCASMNFFEMAAR